MQGRVAKGTRACAQKLWSPTLRLDPLRLCFCVQEAGHRYLWVGVDLHPRLERRNRQAWWHCSQTHFLTILWHHARAASVCVVASPFVPILVVSMLPTFLCVAILDFAAVASSDPGLRRFDQACSSLSDPPSGQKKNISRAGHTPMVGCVTS